MYVLSDLAKHGFIRVVFLGVLTCLFGYVVHYLIVCVFVCVLNASAKCRVILAIFFLSEFPFSRALRLTNAKAKWVRFIQTRH